MFQFLILQCGSKQILFKWPLLVGVAILFPPQLCWPEAAYRPFSLSAVLRIHGSLHPRFQALESQVLVPFAHLYVTLRLCAFMRCRYSVVGLYQIDSHKSPWAPINIYQQDTDSFGTGCITQALWSPVPSYPRPIP